MAIVGIKYRNFGQTEYYSAPDNIEIGDSVLIDCDQGQMLGKVITGPLNNIVKIDEKSLPSIIKKAESNDINEDKNNQNLGKEAIIFCKQCVHERDLDMKVVGIEIYLDRSKFIFYFTAPARIDFRDLVKDLVQKYRTRIELRQIGVRHETQMVGAVGNCGMVCCCRRYFRQFAPVTIKMAKEQNLFLNPAKISGICGRLLCCLSFEQENYDEFYKRCPKLGKKYQTDNGAMKVIRANFFSETINILNENNEEKELTLNEWKALSPNRTEQYVQSNSNNQQKIYDDLMVISASPEMLEQDDWLEDDQEFYNILDNDNQKKSNKHKDKS